jgi:iron complex outermembrane receptor protein
MPTPTHARLHAPRLALTALALACAAAVQAQSPAPQRVEVTGSSIKRIDAESALPVQVIGREEIERAGLTTAAELVARIAAASNGLTDGVSIGTGGFRDQMGMNSANLRGIGTSSTLVLLNGRRMANFASPGDDTGVDLNNIPAAAVERVEVLLDGASAIYGTDAIGGVINFITRKDWRGAELSARVAGTHEGGAGKRTASAGAGLGSLDKDGYNVFAVLDLQKTDALRTSQRAFINDLKIPERLPHLLSSAPSPGNIRLSGDQRDYLQSVGYTINGKPIVNRTINLSAPNCNPPHSLYLPDGIGGEDACTYDYMRDLELYPRTEKTGLLGRGVLQLGRDHQLYAEVSYSRAKSWYAGTSNRVDGDLDVSMIPALAATGLGDALPDDRTITVRTRLLEAGMRTSQITSTGSRIVTGLTGTLAGWEYDLGLNHSVNTVSDRDAHGYLLYDKTMEGIASGLINPFGESSAAGRAYLDSIQVNEEVRRARGTMDSIDLKGNRPVARLGGGDLMLALGAEWRRERSRSNPSELLLSDNILGDPTPGDGVTTDGSRRVGAVFAELVAPVTRRSSCSSPCVMTATRWWAAPPTPRWACAGNPPPACWCGPRPAPAFARRRWPTWSARPRPAVRPRCPTRCAWPRTTTTWAIAPTSGKRAPTATPSSSPSARASFRWASWRSPRARPASASTTGPSPSAT